MPDFKTLTNQFIKCSQLPQCVGSRKRKTARPMKKTKSTEGRCPKCKTIVRFNVSGQIGNEIFECTGCTTKYKVDEL